jgi:ADP-sugar diphosphatase
MSFPTFIKQDGSPFDGDGLTFVSANHTGAKNWISKIQGNFDPSKFTVSSNVVVHAIKPFGPAATARGGFVFAEANIKELSSGKVIPGAAFLRGAAVAILVILKVQETGEDMCLLTVQPRVPIGDPVYEEIPAGMIDGAANFAGVAAKEMEEETGIIIRQNQLKKLGVMIPSAGGCDETITLYLFKDTITSEKAEELQGKATGALDEGEVITLNLQSLSTIQERIRAGELTDAKLLSALYHYFSMGGTDLVRSYEVAVGGRRRRGRSTKKASKKRATHRRKH